MAEWVNGIRKLAQQAEEAGQPSDLCVGLVTSEAPLTITVEQKLPLGKAQLLMTRNVTDYETELEAEGKTVLVRVKNALRTGETVALLRQRGGQRYLVLDRLKGG